MSKGSFKRATIGPPAKRHLNAVSLAGGLWPDTVCWLDSGGHQIVRGYSLIRIFAVNILGSLLCFMFLFIVIN